MQYRNATTEDIPQCIDLLKQDGGFKAEPALWDALPSLWTNQLEQQALAGFQVFEKKQRHTDAKICAFRLSGFVRPEFSASYAANPYPQVAADIWRRVNVGQSPLLNNEEIASANARGDLRLAVLHTCVEHRNPANPDTLKFLTLLPQAWQSAYFGYRLKDLPIFEVFGSVASVLMQNAGYKEYSLTQPEGANAQNNAHGSSVFCWDSSSKICGATGLIAYASTHCPMPQFHFTPAQQRLLQNALDGKSDKEIAAEFSIRYDTVRQSWDSIFQRVDAINDAILPNSAKKGGERRRAIIEYIRQHPEEIRPFDKKASERTDQQTPFLQMLSALPD